MVSKLLNFVRFLDGKKTLIGAIIAFIAYGLAGFGIISQPGLMTVMKYDQLVLGVGLGHKLYKQLF